MSSRKTLLAMYLALAFPAAGANAALSDADQFASVRTIAQKAVLNNPEVRSRWHFFKAADHEVDVAKGGFLPRTELTLGTGREKLQSPSNIRGDLNYTRSGYLLTLNQMLFDGFATSKEVSRLGRAKLTRYYELLEASENAAQEAAKAYLDVLRYRLLVNLAEDNYVQHRATFMQLQRRVQSGVGRRADLEQAGSRMALAEVNLSTELANLHDVSARYQRLVGEFPPQVLFSPAMAGKGMKKTAKEALEIALRRNPSLQAAISNLEAAQFEQESKRAAFSPRLDLRARTDNASNYQGVVGDRVNNVVELVMTYNLTNGGSDIARSKQFAERTYVAAEMRDKACRDVRQTLVIAFNDTERLRNQLSVIGSQAEMIEKTRDAYRDQFNLGQRSLLDLLDTENELLSARRAMVNADADLAFAYIRTYAASGTLLEFFKLKALESDVDPSAKDLFNADAAQLCPAEPVDIPDLDREALDARATALLDSSRVIAGPEGLPSTLLAVKEAGATAGLQAASPSAAGPEEEIRVQVQAWAKAWSRKDYNAYAAFYAPTFMPEAGMAREDWAQLRRGRIEKPKVIMVDVQNLRVRTEKDRMIAEFVQNFSSDLYHDKSHKVLEFIQSGGKWLIAREGSVILGLEKGKK